MAVPGSGADGGAVLVDGGDPVMATHAEAARTDQRIDVESDRQVRRGGPGVGGHINGGCLMIPERDGDVTLRLGVVRGVAEDADALEVVLVVAVARERICTPTTQEGNVMHRAVDACLRRLASPGGGGAECSESCDGKH